MSRRRLAEIAIRELMASCPSAIFDNPGAGGRRLGRRFGFWMSESKRSEPLSRLRLTVCQEFPGDAKSQHAGVTGSVVGFKSRVCDGMNTTTIPITPTSTLLAYPGDRSE